MKAADAIVEVLKRENVKTLFCFPTTSVIENAVAAGIRPIICRQERVGVDMADGYARVTNGRPPGVFAMQYGPGAENAFPGIATTFSDSVPVLFLPLALVSVRAALVQVQPVLEEVGRSLGLGWPAVGWRVVLPLAGPGLGAAAALVFVAIVTELTATLLLAPIGTQTLATQVWADTSTLAFAAAAPYAALMAMLSLLSTWLLARRFAATRLLAG